MAAGLGMLVISVAAMGGCASTNANGDVDVDVNAHGDVDLVADADPVTDAGTDADQPTNRPTDQQTPADPALALLARLEAQSATLTGFTADVRYEIFDALLERQEVRTGELVYQAAAGERSSRFAILFNKIRVGRRQQNRTRHYVFDGAWLTEIDREGGRYVRDQIVPPGKTFDPLKLGEGPFPLPIGQPADEVLARFEVSTFEAPADGPLAPVLKAFNVEGITLVPRPDTPEAEEFARVDLLYDRTTWLPVGINLIEHNGNRKTVRLTEPVRNPAMDAATLARLDVAEPDPAVFHQVVVRPWQEGNP